MIESVMELMTKSELDLKIMNRLLLEVDEAMEDLLCQN